MALGKAYGAEIWGDFVVNGEVTKVNEELGHTGSPLQTLAKADKLIVTAERADDGTHARPGMTPS
jgi:hypothetical protein